MGYLSSVRLNHSMVRSQMLENSFLINNPIKKFETLVPIIPLIGSLAKAHFCTVLGHPISKPVWSDLSDSDIIDIFSDQYDALNMTLEKDVHKDMSDSRVEESLKDIYERLRPGEPKTADSSRALLVARFFDPKRYDLASVGRYKINKKLLKK